MTIGATINGYFELVAGTTPNDFAMSWMSHRSSCCAIEANAPLMEPCVDASTVWVPPSSAVSFPTGQSSPPSDA